MRWRAKILDDSHMHSHHQQMPLTLIPSRIANNLRVGGVVKTAHVKSTSAPKDVVSSPG